MKGHRSKANPGKQDTKKLPLISSEIVLSPKEIAEGCTVVDVPLTFSDRQRLDSAMARTGEGVGYVVRDALRLADITSEEELVLGNQSFVRDAITREIRACEFWPKKKPV